MTTPYNVWPKALNCEFATESNMQSEVQSTSIKWTKFMINQNITPYEINDIKIYKQFT